MSRKEKALTLYAEIEEIARRAKQDGFGEVSHWLGVAGVALSEEADTSRLPNASAPATTETMYLN